MPSLTEVITCEALYSNVGISFWGGIDPNNGKIIDQTHPLHGECVENKILCIPSGRGSCTGSQVMLELILNGKGPRAIILRSADSILCTGAVIAEEFFGDEFPLMAIPIICAVGEEKFAQLVNDGDDSLTITIKEEDESLMLHHDASGNIHRISKDLADLKEEIDGVSKQFDGLRVYIESGSREFMTRNLLNLKDTLDLDAKDMDAIQKSEAASLALRTVRRIASISSATKLIPITCAHIDAVTYIGNGGLRFAQKLSQLNGKVAVPTTLNSQSVDRRRWEQLGVDSSLASNANSVGDAYLELGCEMSFTCAPYLLPTKPSKGDNIMWGESNAVVYSNSVIGARTEKYADYFDICAAIVGKVPNIGVHLDENRVPTIAIDATKLIQDHVLTKIAKNKEVSSDPLQDICEIDSFFPAMGWLCGNLSDGRIPIILGFDALPAVSSDNLKAFCAAFGTTGTAPLFHMPNITPEAIGDDMVQKLLLSCEERQVEVTKEDLCNSYQTLDSGKDGNDKVDVVALGNPHLSVEELKRLVELISIDNRSKQDAVKVIATLGRYIQSKGDELGYTKKLEQFGVQFVNDTCWCMILDPPIIPLDPNARILTNSGKYAHYGPGLTKRRIRFGSMYDCVEAAKSGKTRSSFGNNGSLPQWLRSFSTQRLIRAIKSLR